MGSRQILFCVPWLWVVQSLLAFNVTSWCPTPDESSPCQCEYSLGINLLCNHLQDTESLEKFLSSTTMNYRVLVLLRFSINHIPGRSLNKAMIKILYLRDGTLDTLLDNSDTKNVVHVQVLTIEGVIFTKGFKWSSLLKLQELTKLSVRKCEIPKIDSEFTEFVPSNLTKLIMSETNTEEIVGKAFQKLNNLRQLQLDRNKLHRLHRDMLPVPSNIEFLYFNNNKLTSLPEDIFTDMPGLRSVGLSGNQLSVLSEATFSKIWPTIVFVMVRDNPLKCDCLMEWITKKEMIPSLMGNCIAPKKLYGVKLNRLSPTDFDC